MNRDCRPPSSGLNGCLAKPRLAGDDLRPMATLRICLVCPVALAAACGGAPRPQADPNPGTTPPSNVVATIGDIEPAAEVTAMAFACDPDMTEACNGLDDDCDGRIDDGCGYGTAQVHVVAAWNSDIDLQLVLADAAGTEVSGTRLDQDGRGACDAGGAHPQIESLIWDAPAPGSYRVVGRLVDRCGASEDAVTTLSVSIALAGTVLGPFNRSLPEMADAEVVGFELR